MRIGINVSFSRKKDTGIGQVTVNFLDALIKSGIDEIVFSSKRLKPSERIKFLVYSEEPLAESIILPENWKMSIFLPPYRRDDLIRKIWWEKFELPQKVKKDKCHFFLSMYQCPTIIKGAKHIMLVHDIIPKIFPEYLNNSRKKIYWNMTEKAIRRADKIIAVSYSTQRDLINLLNVDPDKILVSYIDVNPIFKNNLTIENSLTILKKYQLEPGYIYYGGGLEKRKNVEVLLKAYKCLLDRSHKTSFLDNFPQLVISGRLMPKLAPLVTDVESLVHNMNLVSSVKILGYVPQEDLPALYKNAMFFIYPSLYEGFGLPVLEAMNMGVPVITSKVSSLPEVGSDAVLYCDPHNIEDITMVMKNLMTNEALRQELASKAKKRAEFFSWHKFINVLFDWIKHQHVQ